jgi:hypothetical protein
MSSGFNDSAMQRLLNLVSVSPDAPITKIKLDGKLPDSPMEDHQIRALPGADIPFQQHPLVVSS